MRILNISFSQILLTTLIVATTQPVLAKDGIKVGINAVYSDKGFSNYDNQISVLPSLFYDNNKIYARGNSLGYNLIKDSQSELSLFTQYSGANFNPDQATGSFHDLDKRTPSMLTGISYIKITPFGGLRSQLATDISGNSKGTVAKLTYLAKIKKNNLTLYPSAGIQWQDNKYNDYYYGVNDSESKRTGIKNYSASDSFHPYISLMGMYDLENNWGLFMNQNLSYNPDELYNSPKVDNHASFTSTLGITYQF